MSPKRQPAPPARDNAPVVCRVRLRYAKRGRLRFSSHRDFQRALERAIRRADLPVAYSSGFSPHPKISFAGAAPTGTASEAEYVELGLTAERDPGSIRDALDVALPDGLDVLEVVVAGPGSLADRLQASIWEIELPGVGEDTIDAAIEAFLASETIEVERVTKNGRRVFDVRSAVARLFRTGRAMESGNGVGGEACAILQVVVQHGTPAVRPDDVLAGLRLVAGLVPPIPPRITRVTQGMWDIESGIVGDPLAPDRDAAVTGM